MYQKYITKMNLVLFLMGTLFGDNGEITRAGRPDAPSVISPISVVVPSLDLGAIQQTIAAINCKIGNVNQGVCQDTILSVLGDACTILGISISEALAILLECCDTQTSSLVCGAPIPIRQSDIPFTIVEPGVYCLAEDVIVPDAGTGITVSANDVIFNLNDHQIVGGIAAIVIGDQQNITIKNGICRDQTGNNVTFGGSVANVMIQDCQLLEAVSNGLEVTDFFRDIIISNCIIKSVTASGILVDSGVGEGDHLNMVVRDCFVDAGNIAIDFQADEQCLSINIQNCQITGLTTGINLSNTLGVNITNSTIHRSTSGIIIADTSLLTSIQNTDVSLNLAGGIFTAGQYTQIVNANIINNTGTGVDFLGTSTNSSVHNSIISNNGTGIGIASGSITIENCDVKNNTAVGITVSASASTTVIRGCEILSNSSDGIDFFGSDCVIETCFCNNNGMHGIQGRLDSTLLVIKNCQTNNNTLTGVFLEGLTSQIIDSSSMGNGVDGFLVSSAPAPLSTTEVINNVATNNGNFGFASNESTLKFYKNFAANNTAGDYVGITPVNTPGGALAGTYDDFIANTAN